MVPSYRVSAQLALVLAGILVGFVLGSTDAWRPSGARAPIPELSSLSCDNQNWTETDVCLTRTAPLAAAKGDALVAKGRSVKVAANSTGTSDAGNWPFAAEAWRLSAARAPIPELPPQPCNKQSWTNADRVCLTWTVPLASAEAEALVVLDQAERVAEDSTGTAGMTSSTAVARRLRGARARVPEPPPLPCNMQNWTEGERVCLSWTAPLDAAKAEAVAAPGPSVRGPSTSNTGDTIR